MKRKILFITRNYPPKVGGLEEYSFHLIREFAFRDIQGLRDAVIDGKTGYLVAEGDVEGFVGRITDMNLKKDQIRKTVNSTFDWAKIYKDYRIFLFSGTSSTGCFLDLK